MLHYSNPMNLFVYRLVKIIANLVLRPFFHIHISGLTNIPERGAFILLPKHQRWEDIPLIGICVQRPLYYVAKEELFRNPVSGWFISSLGGIPLNRERPLESRNSFRMIMENIKKGEGVVLFPEGTYYRDRMGTGHAGLIRMITSRSAVPFIPVGVRYTKKRWRTDVRMVIGESVYGISLKGTNEFIALIMSEIGRLSGLRPATGTERGG